MLRKVWEKVLREVWEGGLYEGSVEAGTAEGGVGGSLGRGEGGEVATGSVGGRSEKEWLLREGEIDSLRLSVRVAQLLSRLFDVSFILFPSISAFLSPFLLSFRSLLRLSLLYFSSFLSSRLFSLLFSVSHFFFFSTYLLSIFLLSSPSFLSFCTISFPFPSLSHHFLFLSSLSCFLDKECN